jgi:hypothetical protein
VAAANARHHVSQLVRHLAQLQTRLAKTTNKLIFKQKGVTKHTLLFCLKYGIEIFYVLK